MEELCVPGLVIDRIRVRAQERPPSGNGKSKQTRMTLRLEAPIEVMTKRRVNAVARGDWCIVPRGLVEADSNVKRVGLYGSGTEESRAEALESSGAG
jgi:hypothetical protein